MNDKEKIESLENRVLDLESRMNNLLLGCPAPVENVIGVTSLTLNTTPVPYGSVFVSTCPTCGK